MSEELVMTEGEALELLAFLVTAARTQVDEAAEYAPLRLLAGATRLADVVASRVSPKTRALLAGPLRAMPATAVPSEDRDGYVARLDALCAAVADRLVEHFDLDRQEP